ncbi:hypothetical protein AAHB94_31310 [Bacillus toyonensis]
MEMWSVEQVESAQLEDLIQFLLESTARRKAFELKFEEIDQDLHFSNAITFEHIKDHFRFDVENREYIYPHGDERELYKGAFMKHKKLPVKGFFWVLNTERESNPLGS